MKILICLIVLVVLSIYWSNRSTQAASIAMPKANSVYDFTVKTIDEKYINLGDYKGKVLLIVNTASRCGFTPQYHGLETIYEQFRGQGFEILAFPANNFMGQEPGSNQEIKTFCSLKYKTSFPLFSKISVMGADMAPLYRYLTSQSGFNGDITWNFNKFLVDKTGKVVARFGSKDEPQSDKIVNQIKGLLST